LLGVDRDGVPLLVHAQRTGGRYQLSERVASDYGLFHELVSEADETPDAGEAASLLAEALTLVRDEPFKGAANSYAWVAADRGIVVAQVVDAADELAEVRLAVGDWRGAEWAARRGLAACPSDERLYRQLALAAFGARNLAAVRRILRELLDAVADPDCGVEPEDTVHPETLAFFDELLAGRRPVGDGGAGPGRARTG
jgi:DNA-binding SARP family transcriptional activator